MLVGGYRGSLFFLYELIDPRSGESGYVGSSDRGMIRPRYHSYSSALKRDRRPGGNAAKANWIEGLPTREDDQPYDIRVVQEFASSEELWTPVPPPRKGLGLGRFEGLDYPEEWLIRSCRADGAPLTNAAPGGPSPMLGRRHTEAARKKIADAGKRPASVETRAKIARTLSGHAVSDETRKKIGDANRGRAVSDELRQRRGVAISISMKTQGMHERLSESTKRGWETRRKKQGK